MAELPFVAIQVSNREIVYPAENFLFTELVYFVICCALEFGALRVAKQYRGYVS